MPHANGNADPGLNLHRIEHPDGHADADHHANTHGYPHMPRSTAAGHVSRWPGRRLYRSALFHQLWMRHGDGHPNADGYAFYDSREFAYQDQDAVQPRPDGDAPPGYGDAEAQHHRLLRRARERRRLLRLLWTATMLSARFWI